MIGMVFFMLCATAFGGGYQRIVSINMCTDQLLYLLEDKGQIASLSFLSSDSAYSPIAGEAGEFPVNHAYIEEILPLAPDLVLAGRYSDSHVIHFLRSKGIHVEQIDIPHTLGEIRQALLDVGKLLGREKRARTILHNMQQRRQEITRKLAGTRKPLAVILAPNGFTHGKNSMKGEILEAAHYENLAASIGIKGSGYVDLETLVDLQPDFIIIEDSADNKNSLSQRFLEHPALKKALPDTRRIALHPNLWSCGSPFVIDALQVLADAHPKEAAR